MLSNVKKKGMSPAAAHRVKKNVASNRISVFLLVAIAAMGAIIMLKKSTLSTEMNFYHYVRPVLLPVFAILTAGAIVLMVMRRRHGVEESSYYFPSSMMLCIAAGLTVLCLAYPYFSSTRLLVLTAAGAALYVIYYLYPRDFFVYSLFTLAGSMCVSFMRIKSNPVLTVILAVLGGIMVVLALLALFKPDSVLSNTKKYPFFITAVLTIAGILLGLLLPFAAFYAVIALFAAFLVIAVMNTLRLI